jgi:hypothetical protein
MTILCIHESRSHYFVSFSNNEAAVSSLHYTSWGMGLRYYATNRKVMGSTPDEVIGLFSRTNPSSRTVALGLTQPLTEMTTRNPVGVKGGRLAREANNLSAICEPIVKKMWEPRRDTNLWASTAWYRDSFTFYYMSSVVFRGKCVRALWMYLLLNVL